MKYFLLSVCFLMLFFSCRKDPKIAPPKLPSPHVSIENTEGSYFVYHWFEIDSVGNETQLQYIDTVWVQVDTMINGNTFTHTKGNYYVYPVKNWFFRDSLGYVVDQNGLIHYSYNNSDTVKVDTSGFEQRFTINVNNLNDKYAMPSGLINNQIIAPKPLPYFDHQIHRTYKTQSYTACDSIWIQHIKYVNGYGEVASQSGYISALISECKYAQRRLVFFDIK